MSPSVEQAFSIPLPLPEQQVELWLLNHKNVSESDLVHCKTLLSADELQRNNRLGKSDHRKRDIVCRGVLRQLLAYYLSVSNDDLELSRTENGKPVMQNHPRALQFNYSHSGDYIAYAFCKEPAIGVDIEYCRRNNNLAGIARRHFAEDEIKNLFALSATEQRRRFFELWTLKEAYIKARGEGIFIGLGNFSFEIDTYAANDIGINFISDSFDVPNNWQFYSTTPEPDYRVSVAVNLQQPTFKVIRRDHNGTFPQWFRQTIFA